MSCVIGRRSFPPSLPLPFFPHLLSPFEGVDRTIGPVAGRKFQVYQQGRGNTKNEEEDRRKSKGGREILSIHVGDVLRVLNTTVSVRRSRSESMSDEEKKGNKSEN